MVRMTITTPSPFRRSAIALAGFALVAGLLSGCASGGTPSPTDGTSGAGDPRERASAISACMRDKGYDMADEASNKVSVPEGVDADQYTKDLETCAKSVPGGVAGEAAAAPPGGTESAALAKCVRQGGFTDYPDDLEAQAEYEAADEKGLEERYDHCLRELSGTTDSATPVG
jgi:hypothetical protein